MYIIPVYRQNDRTSHDSQFDVFLACAGSPLLYLSHPENYSLGHAVVETI